MHVILLGPCFKTGRVEAFRQRRDGAVPVGLEERREGSSVAPAA